jgi:hypothetical protein
MTMLRKPIMYAEKYPFYAMYESGGQTLNLVSFTVRMNKGEVISRTLRYRRSGQGWNELYEVVFYQNPNYGTLIYKGDDLDIALYGDGREKGAYEFVEDILPESPQKI